MVRACHVGIIGPSHRTPNRIGWVGARLGKPSSDIRAAGRFRGYLAYSGESSPRRLPRSADSEARAVLGNSSDRDCHRNASAGAIELAAMEIPGGSCRSACGRGPRDLLADEHRRRAAMNGVPVERLTERHDYRSAPSLRNVLRTGRFDIGVCRLTAGLFFSMRRRPPRGGFGGRLIGIFLRPLHSGRDLTKRFLDPTLAAEIRHDRHHAALYASRLLGTWSNAPAYVDRYVFLWDTDRQCGTAAGLPPSSCAVIRHPFNPFFLERGPLNPSPRLGGIVSPARRRVVFTGPPEGSRGVGDMLRLPHYLPRDPATQVILLLRDGTNPEPVTTRTRVGAHELVVVRGLLSREELRTAYRVSQVAVFPYRFVRTGLPLVALEAVATGLPVVTTRVHPIRELEGRTGLVL